MNYLKRIEKLAMGDFLSRFLKKYNFRHPSLLLALSGGPDSLFLFHHLLRLSRKGSCSFAVAHIDHGWRVTSGKEASLLEERCEQLGIPFFLKRLHFEKKANLEDEARRGRLAFFKELVETHHFDGVILGHQSDEVAETVLKRVLEGAPLEKLYALKEVLHWEGMTLLRPLLQVRKKEILAWLEKEKEDPFIDPTNESGDFLRAKLRSLILPELTKNFGKEIVPSLCRVAKHSLELEEFLERHLQLYSDCFKSSFVGEWGDFSQKFPPTIFEWKALLRQWGRRRGMAFSDTHLEQVVDLLQVRSAGKELKIGNKRIFVDRGSLFHFTQEFKTFLSVQKLSRGEWGDWKIDIEEGDFKLKFSSWKDLWERGALEVILPAHNSYLIGLQRDASLQRRYANNKVPRYLRDKVPYIIDLKRNSMAHEFLTGKPLLLNLNGQSTIKIKLKHSLSTT